jgi:DNA repair exonuclease SbcCD nuclease subunit
MDHSFYTQQNWFLNDFIAELQECKAKAKHIVFIGGNHDTYLAEVSISDGNSRRINNQLPDDVHYLCDESIELDGIKIYGTPWCVLPPWARSGGPVWNFARRDEALSAIYQDIPDGVDILLTHGPAYRFCDAILDDKTLEKQQSTWDTSGSPEPLGSKALFLAISELKQKPKYVLSGHIHSAKRDYEIYQPEVPGDKVKFSCCSILNEEYKFCDSQPSLIINFNEEEKENQTGG